MGVVGSIIKKSLAARGYSVVKTTRLRELMDQRQARHSVQLETPLDSINVARFLYLDQLVSETQGVAGDIVECGVGRGRSLLCLAHSVRSRNDGRCLWGFDSFEGFPTPSEEDMSTRAPKKGQYAVPIKAVDSMLRDYLQDEQFLRSRVTLVKGFFDETLDKLPASAISLLNLDVDLYDSYRTCLAKLWPRLSPGGIVTFDEYLRERDAFPGALRAIEEHFAGLGCKFIRDRFYGKYYVIKQDG